MFTWWLKKIYENLISNPKTIRHEMFNKISMWKKIGDLFLTRLYLIIICILYHNVILISHDGFCLVVGYVASEPLVY